MSKLINQIEAIQTQRQYAIVEPLNFFQFEEKYEHQKNPTAYLYRIEARFGARQIIPLSKNFDEDKEMIKIYQERVRSQVANEVYGEFRQMIYDIQNLIHMRDEMKAIQLLNKMYDTMFNVWGER